MTRSIRICGRCRPGVRGGGAGAGAGGAMAGVGALCALDRAGGYRAACGLLGAEAADIAAFLDIARLLYDGPWVAKHTAAPREVVVGRPGIMHPVTRAIVAAGPERRTVDAFDAFHALVGVRRLAAELFGKYDALLLPTAPLCPTLAELAANPVGPNARLGTFTNFANLWDLAAIAVPAGFGADGMPVGVTVGVTVLGPTWAEGRLAAIADHVHRSLSAGVPDAAPADVLAGDETTLFCIGAHMSGLALNGQVTSLGGRFLRAAAYLITTAEGAALHLVRLRNRMGEFDPDVRDRLIAGADAGPGPEIPPQVPRRRVAAVRRGGAAGATESGPVHPADFVHRPAGGGGSGGWPSAHRCAGGHRARGARTPPCASPATWKHRAWPSSSGRPADAGQHPRGAGRGRGRLCPL